MELLLAVIEPIASFVLELILSFLFWALLLPLVCVFITPPILFAGMFGRESYRANVRAGFLGFWRYWCEWGTFFSPW